MTRRGDKKPKGADDGDRRQRGSAKDPAAPQTDANVGDSDRPSAPAPRIKLPPFGTAEDLLRQLDAEGRADGAAPTDASGSAAPVPPKGGPADDWLGWDPEARPGTDDGDADADEDAAEESFQLVSFRLGREEFALPVSEIREINRVGEITRVPNTPPHVLGVINQRGRILPVIDLMTRLELGAVERGDSNRFVIAERGSRLLGLLVDAVSRVLSIDERLVEPPPEALALKEGNYVKGVVKLPDATMTLLNLEVIFDVIK